jgi:hypothetical protein
MEKVDSSTTARCAFCRRAQDEVMILMRGKKSPAVCDRCVGDLNWTILAYPNEVVAKLVPLDSQLIQEA